jgi:hypothetical protein
MVTTLSQSARVERQGAFSAIIRGVRQEVPPLRKALRVRWHKCRRPQGPCNMSKWQEEKEKRNRRSIARLTRALPDIFALTVLSRALDRPFVPPTPRLAIDSYWRAHPIRADRLARSLAARSGAPHGWTWRLGQDRESRLPTTFRIPPAPYRERAHVKGPGLCCVCGQPVYRYGWHVDLWDKGMNKNASWHCACVIAWQFWNAPSSEATILRRLQSRRCSQTGGRLWKTAEVDHFSGKRNVDARDKTITEDVCVHSGASNGSATRSYRISTSPYHAIGPLSSP